MGLQQVSETTLRMALGLRVLKLLPYSTSASSMALQWDTMDEEIKGYCGENPELPKVLSVKLVFSQSS